MAAFNLASKMAAKLSFQVYLLEFTGKNKQIFDIYNTKNSLKKERPEKQFPAVLLHMA